MKFAALLGTKDEADILPLAIEQLRYIGVELIIVMDVASTDDTLAYLAEAEAAGDIWVFQDNFDETPDGTGREVKAALARASEAEWVLFLDSDEIALPRHGTLHDLEDLDGHDILAVPRYNVALGPEGPHMPSEMTPAHYDDVLIYAQPIPDFYYHMRREPLTPWIRGVLEPKTLVRSEAVAAMHPGDHDIDATTVKPWRRAVAHDLLLAHVPFRDLERFEMRSANYLAEVDADPEAFSGWTAWQWRRFADMQREGRTAEEYDRQVIDADEMAALRDQRVVRSVAEVFAEPITGARGDEEWMSMAARAEPWLTATSMVSRRERIQPGGKLEHLSGSGRYPAVLLPPDHVVRFYGPWRGGIEASGREAHVLRLLEAHGAPQVPRVVATGELEPDLHYIVMTRMPGVARRQIEYELSGDDRIAIAGWMGDVVRQLQAAPLSHEDRTAGWDRFEEIARARYDEVERSALGRGLAPELVGRLDGWLPGIDALMGKPDDAVLCHGSLGASSVMGQPAEPSFVPTGVVDLSRSFVGPPLADFGAIWWDILERDPDALERFLGTSGLGQDPGFERHALAWALMAPFSKTPALDDVGNIVDPDDLADRWFGGHPASSPGGSSPRPSSHVDDPDEPAQAASHGVTGVETAGMEAPTVSATASPGEHEALEQLESLSRSEDAYQLARHQAEPWTRAAGIVCDREGLPVDGPPRPIESGSRPAIRVPQGHVIKFYGPWDWGDILFDQEVQALQRLDRDPELPVTRLVAAGWLSESWRYAVLSWVDGARLKDVEAGRWAEDASGLLTWLGRFVRSLHAVPLEPDEGADGLVQHDKVVAYRHREAARRAGERNLLPPHLLAQIDAWLPPLGELIADSPDAVLVHADLTPSNIIGEAAASGFSPIRVIDFNQSVVAHALYELGPVWWTILEGEPQRTRTFLSEAHLPGMPDRIPPRHALAWALLNPAWRPQPFAWLDSVGSLDDVAARAFGDGR